MPSEMGIRDGYGGEDVGLLLLEQRRQEAIVREREMDLLRSGSAPPTMEGLENQNGFLTEEELRSDPAYLSYYYSNAHLNPRLPPPLLSKEDWRSTQRLPVGIGRKPNRVGDEGGRSLFSMQPGIVTESNGVSDSGDWLVKGGDGLIGLPGIEIGRHKCSDDYFQDDLSCLSHPSHLDGRNSNSNAFSLLGSGETQNALHNEVGAIGGLQPGGNAQNVTGIQNNGSSASRTFASVLGPSLPRTASPDPQLIGRAPSPRHPPVGVRLGANDKNSSSNSCSFASAGAAEHEDIVASFSGMSLSASRSINKDFIAPSNLQTEIDNNRNFFVERQGAKHNVEQHSYLSEPGLLDCGNAAYANFGPGGCSINPAVNHINPSFSPLFGNAAVGSGFASPSLGSRSPGGGLSSRLILNGATDLLDPNRIGSPTAAAAPQKPIDPLYIQYIKAAEFAAQVAASFNDPPPVERTHLGNSYVDLLGCQKAYLRMMPQPHRQYSIPLVGNSGGLNHVYYGNPASCLAYPGSPLASPILPASPAGPGSPLRHGEPNMCFPSGMRNLAAGAMSSWHSDIKSNMDDSFVPTLLEELKSNKTKCYELLEIGGHVVEFSVDQYGSRFIQQKLETATTEEINMVFQEIMPQALTLMTDVFGNYVVQKFFEHGSAAQRGELADQLAGHVLALSLQMYGCRVIQKAIEVVDLDQQMKMVAELDGHVMRCVRDQNGNHVIQKCIECIPQDAIQFIITTFYDQVVTLSTHPYGCRVIQRVLEHCDEPKTQQIMMDEIFQSVCLLAQNQYGNYVVQHVLEHGKPHERSAIIKKLAGQIVQMSQQKFASNVVEKCLAFGGPVERQILINEMLGSTDENEPLQAMMKDQFANYVVQKVLETCDDQQRELILTRIKVHLNALKRYTYGKHIVARVEKLVAAGERRIGIQPSYTS
ncbi:pumilio homolog 1-like [Typha angustifolia]|uniref:pumilio homolog 1-like n=1 Tax=Typha angustifolia TaxID=59011 RepID=UPI003C304EE9